MHACLESSPPDHPARFKLRICVEAGLLADGVQALGLAFTAPSRWLCRQSWQWRGSEQHRSQLRGQPRLGPRSLLSFGVGRRTSKGQGYAWVGCGSMGVGFSGFWFVGISVAAVTASYGFALTATHFSRRRKVSKRLSPRRTALRLGSVFPRYGAHQGASPPVCCAAPPLDECGCAARRCAPTPDGHLRSACRWAGDQKPHQKPLTLALSQRERGLTEWFGRATPTCDTTLNSGFEQHTNRPPLLGERAGVRGKSTAKPAVVN